MYAGARQGQVLKECPTENYYIAPTLRGAQFLLEAIFADRGNLVIATPSKRKKLWHLLFAVQANLPKP